jgi:hypothetical protein
MARTVLGQGSSLGVMHPCSEKARTGTHNKKSISDLCSVLDSRKHSIFDPAHFLPALMTNHFEVFINYCKIICNAKLWVIEPCFVPIICKTVSYRHKSQSACPVPPTSTTLAHISTFFDVPSSLLNLTNRSQVLQLTGNLSVAGTTWS